MRSTSNPLEFQAGDGKTGPEKQPPAFISESEACRVDQYSLTSAFKTESVKHLFRVFPIQFLNTSIHLAIGTSKMMDRRSKKKALDSKGCRGGAEKALSRFNAVRLKPHGRPLLARWCDGCGRVHYYEIKAAGQPVASGCIDEGSPEHGAFIVVEERPA